MTDDKTINHRRWEELLPSLNQYSNETKRTLRQKHIDYIRYKAMIYGLVTFLRTMHIVWREAGEVAALEHSAAMKPGPQHIWFDGEDLMSYGIRSGNAPSDSQRPKWARQLNLEIDYMQLPQAVWLKCAPGGEYAQMVEDGGQYEEAHKETIIRPNDLQKNQIIIT